PGAVAVGNPFELKPALLFAGLLAVVSLASAVAAGRLGETGLFAVAFVSGLADVDAMTLSAARGAMSGAMAIGPAGYAVLIAVAANIIAKGAMAL
ncbi:MAG TPA: mgtC family protein, partial [Parvularcula sp.]|nr:mgtC family protein [Parvularcula sp.]